MTNTMCWRPLLPLRRRPRGAAAVQGRMTRRSRVLRHWRQRRQSQTSRGERAVCAVWFVWEYMG
jgi:hypothetical protein